MKYLIQGSIGSSFLLIGIALVATVIEGAYFFRVVQVLYFKGAQEHPEGQAYGAGQSTRAQDTKMRNEKLKKELASVFKDIRVNFPEDNRTIITVEKEQVLAILDFLKDRGYDHLGLISCVDWLKEKEFELIYFLNRYQEKEYIILKTRISREKPEFITAIPIFKNAEPYEREIHELFGIKFAGHPRLTHLFLERDYKIPPFKKDFDTRKYVEETFGKIPDIENRQD